ncbi:hypothetical protein diail_5714 [Diaporthe ilicicola]|nr:hypothetical protein diail_5714 [Diaporthe ilicicola]
MTKPESTATMHGGEHSINGGVQLQLIQLLKEQNRLLQQLIESKPAADSPDNLTLLREPSREEWISLDESLSHEQEELAHQAKAVFWHMIDPISLNHALRDWNRSANSADHSQRVIDQLENLNKDLSTFATFPLLNAQEECISTKYIHEQSENGGRSHIGTIWFVL